VLANVAWQMSLNRKMGALKGLQGHVWRDAFVSGEVKGQIYGDVYDAMRRWRAAGVKLYIYSSGSVEAQKLVFGHSVHGDMTPLLDGYFDTAVGHKRERGAYDAILAAIDCAPAEALFLTDIYEESVAADAAGMGTCACFLHFVFPITPVMFAPLTRCFRSLLMVCPLIPRNDSTDPRRQRAAARGQRVPHRHDLRQHLLKRPC
jgi:HAD superfamily hydrolase (TIGR01549 family)